MLKCTRNLPQKLCILPHSNEYLEGHDYDMETHHWYCRFFDQVRVKKGLPLVDERTGQQFFCPKIFSSFHSFRMHAFKCHAKDIAGGAGLAFKHVIGPGHGAAARNAVPVLRDASDEE